MRKTGDCKKVKGMLSPYMDGQLNPGEVDKVERHLRQCDTCRRELDSLEQAAGLLRQVPAVEPRCSFAVPAGAVTRRPALLGALRVAAATAAVFLALVLVGDAVGFFAAAPAEERTGRQEYADTFDTPSPADGGLLGAEETVTEPGYTWPVRPVEFGLAGMTVVLGGASVVLWVRQRHREQMVAEKAFRDRGGGK
ncbi:MAG: anti-sigma factor family protein [Chloroflexota bacterium]